MAEFFKRLQKAKLIRSSAKTEFAKAEVIFLGHSIGYRRMMPRNMKRMAREESPRPTSKKKVLQFLGLSTFSGIFVPNVRTPVALLMDLLKKRTRNISGQNNAFENLKTVL